MAESHQPALVLIVDDEPEILDLLQDRFAGEGFVCTACLTGEQAWSLLEQRQFDVVVADMNLPGLSGLDLLQMARRRYPWIAFLIATGVQDLQLAVTAMKAGADDYILKPFELELVVGGLRRALDRRRMEAEFERYHQHLEDLVAERTQQLRMALHQIEATYDQTLQTLGMALDLRAHEVAGHSLRVSRYSVEIASRLGYERDALVRLARAAYLHDIGKLGIPDAILLKPGPLTEEEQTIMRSHVRIGFELVNRIDLLQSAGDLILTHQERYDGSGYPNALSGESIPLDARIFAVADTLDAMTSDRPYRDAMPLDAARAEISRQTATQFDPRVVRTFLEIPASRWQQIRAELAERYGAAGLFPSADDLVGHVAAQLGAVLPAHPVKPGVSPPESGGQRGKAAAPAME